VELLRLPEQAATTTTTRCDAWRSFPSLPRSLGLPLPGGGERGAPLPEDNSFGGSPPVLPSPFAHPRGTVRPFSPGRAAARRIKRK